ADASREPGAPTDLRTCVPRRLQRDGRTPSSCLVLDGCARYFTSWRSVLVGSGPLGGLPLERSLRDVGDALERDILRPNSFASLRGCPVRRGGRQHLTRHGDFTRSLGESIRLEIALQNCAVVLVVLRRPLMDLAPCQQLDVWS